MPEVVVSTNAESFTRPSLDEARALASELEKEGHEVQVDGARFLNSAGPDGLYLHQSTASCPLCLKYEGCARCESIKAIKGEYYSVKPTHYHSREVDGVKGHAGIHEILCYDCHRQDRFEVYGPSYGESEIAA